MNTCATFYLLYNKATLQLVSTNLQLAKLWSAAWDRFPSCSFWHFFTYQNKKKTNFVNPLIALSRIYREPSSVKHVTVNKSEAVRRLIDHDRLKRLEWLLSAKSEIQTVISEYYCDFTNSKTSWNIFEFLCVWCNTWLFCPSVFPYPVPPIEENVLDEGKLLKPWDTKKVEKTWRTVQSFSYFLIPQESFILLL